MKYPSSGGVVVAADAPTLIAPVYNVVDVRLIVGVIFAVPDIFALRLICGTVTFFNYVVPFTVLYTVLFIQPV